MTKARRSIRARPTTGAGSGRFAVAWRLIVFAGIGVFAVLGLVVLPDRAHDDALDHTTGLPARTPTVVLAQAQGCGDARAALDLLLAVTGAETDPLLTASVDLLRTELEAPKLPTDAAHPLQARLAAAFTPDTLTPVLQQLEADAQQAVRIEHFFAPTANRVAVGEQPLPPDARAAGVLHRLAQGERLDLAAHLAVAAAFGAAGRTRARTRWMLRAFAAFPNDDRLRLQLAQMFTKDGRYREALVTTSTNLARTADDQAFWRLRAQLASWLGAKSVEAGALEVVLQGQPNATELRLRLIELYAALGQSSAASAHASVLADHSRALLDREHAIEASLQAGDATKAVDHLQSLVAAGHGVRLARERIVDIALLDLDFGLAIATLRDLDAAHPEHDAYMARLEVLYRKRDMAEPLADLLLRRFADTTADLELGLELLHLLVGLDRRAEAERVLRQLEDAQARPVTFFRQIARIAATSALQREQSVEIRAAELATASGLTAADLPQALEGLRPLARQRRFKPALETLARRFAAEPVMQRFLLDLVEGESDVETSARTAEQVARLTNEASLVREWAKRASWVGMQDSERAARARLTELNPDDQENRQALAWMLTSAGDHAGAVPHWRYLVEHGQHGEVATAYVAALLRCGGTEEALRFLSAQGERQDATLDERLQAADALLAANLCAAAATCYERVLALAPEHPDALLRLGQIKFWANDPGGALPLLRRRLAMDAARGTDNPQAHFALAEALTALGQCADAVPHYETTLAALREAQPSKPEDAELTARCLARLHRTDAAIAAYRAVLQARPDAHDLRLDLADLLHSAGADAAARDAIEETLRRVPDHGRAVRALAEADRREGHYHAARKGLERSLELHGADAEVFAALAQTNELDGAYGGALDAYRRWLVLQPGRAEPLRGARDMFDRTATMLGGEVRYARTGRDHHTQAQAHASADASERLRVSAHVGLGDYSGRSPAVGNGLVALDATVWTLGAQVAWRFAGRHELGVGGEIYPGAPGDAAAGWVHLHLEDHDPYAALDVHASVGELWTDVAAGPALGARRDGGDVRGYVNLGTRMWLAGELGLGVLRARDASSGASNGDEVEDGLLQGQVALGYRMTEGAFSAVADRFRRDRVPSGPFGPTAMPQGGERWHAAGWLALQTTRLLGDEELPRLLPVGDRFDYTLLAARVDHRLSQGLGLMTEGYIGRELHTGDTTWSIGAAAAFRRSDGIEATVGASCGDALARQGAGSATSSFFFQLHARW